MGRRVRTAIPLTREIKSLGGGKPEKDREKICHHCSSYISTASFFDSDNKSPMSSLHFCQECNNLLYPRADPQRRIMVYACRICPYDEIGENKCVYRNDLLKVTKEQVGVTQDLGSDPTLPHSNIPCPRCSHEDAVFYQDQSKRKETRMILFFVCAKCNFSFLDPTLPQDNKPDL